MHLLTRVLAAIAVALPSLVATGGAAAVGSALPPRDQTTVLVKWVKAPPPGATIVGELKTKVKIVKVPRLWTIEQTVKFYESLPGVAYAEPNYVAGQHAVAAPNDTFFPQQWGLAKISAQAGWGVYSGDYGPAGAMIAVVDTGVDAGHPDLAGQVAAGANCTTGVCLAGGLTIDDNGHGTLNAGAAAAAANNNGRGIAGVAHGARILPVKVLGAGGTGTYASISAGIIWAADNGAKVINLSLGGIAASRTLCDAVNYALDRGVFVDAASGNLAISDRVYPASCPGVVGVGATDPNDAVPAWSDTGQGNVFVVAPGVLVHGTYPGDRYALGTGTSVSTALVSGLASLLLGQNPSRTPAEIRRILAVSTDKSGTAAYGADPYETCSGCTWNASSGYGRINVYRALTTQPAPSTPPPPGDSGGSGSGSGTPAPPAPAPDFTLAVPVAAVTAQQGTDAKWTLSTSAQNGFGGQVSLAVTGLPAGASASFAPTSVPGSGSSVLSVSVGADTPAGSYTLTVRGTSGALVHTATASLTVTAAPSPGPQVEFGLLATPGSTIVKPGLFKTISIRAQGPTGLVTGVQLSAAGMPAGVTVSFTPSSAGVWLMRIDAAPTVVKFTNATLVVTGKLGTLTRTVSITTTYM